MALVIADMGRIQGMVKAESDIIPRVRMELTGTCVSIRATTANDILASIGRWQALLRTLVEDDPPVEVGE